MTMADLQPEARLDSVSEERPIAMSARELETRLRRSTEPHIDALWLFIRRLGVTDSDVDDIVQDALLVLAKRLVDIRPGAEKSFLFSTAHRMAADRRKRVTRKSEVSDDVLAERIDSSPGVDTLMDEQRALEELDQVLESMPLDLRAVFVLHELEEHTMVEIAELLSLAPGTVASRLRRARELFVRGFARFRREEGRP
jgi:RNA polymerase sigma-70 factor (ECF subfamily)